MGALVAIVGILLLAGLLGRQTPPPELQARPTQPAPDTATLPFDPPSAQSLQSSGKLVFAHYFPPLPVSLDNQEPDEDYYTRNYLHPDGEDRKHAAYGGHLRDRPLVRAPIPDADWRLQDMRTEVRQAVAGGLDGFTLDVLQLEGGSDPRLWENVVLLLQAAHDVDPAFKIVIIPDMSGSLSKESVEAVADGVARLADYPAAYRLRDGRLLVSPFKAEGHSVRWWASFLEEMEREHGIAVALMPTFVGDIKRYAATFDEISYGMSSWGSRNPAHNDPRDTGAGSARARVKKVRTLGQKWMQPVSVQDERPNQGIYDEAENTRNLRHTWSLARATDAEFVQVATWNDYSEGTSIAPSAKHGWTFLDLTAYYSAWFKSGTPPAIVRDAVYLTHRTQPVDAEPTYDQTQLMERRGGSPARDTVEALTFLTAPATVVVRVGEREHRCSADAGIDICTVPLGTGAVSARVVRGPDTVAAVTSPHEVTDKPRVQDLQYVGVSSLRHDG